MARPANFAFARSEPYEGLGVVRSLEASIQIDFCRVSAAVSGMNAAANTPGRVSPTRLITIYPGAVRGRTGITPDSHGLMLVECAKTDQRVPKLTCELIPIGNRSRILQLSSFPSHAVSGMVCAVDGSRSGYSNLGRAAIARVSSWYSFEHWIALCSF